MRIVQGDADTFLVWLGKTDPTTYTRLQSGEGKSGGLDEGWVVAPPSTYAEVGKDLVFVTDVVLSPGSVANNSYFQFVVGNGQMSQAVLLNWGDTLASRQIGPYNSHLKYSRLVITGVDVCTPEFFYDLGGGDRTADGTWGVTPGGPSSWFVTHIRIGLMTMDLTGESPVYVLPDPMWTFGNAETGTLLMAETGAMARGFVQPTAVALPQVVGRTQISAESETRGNLVCMTMKNHNGNSVTVPSDPAWRLRVALRGYVA